MFILFNKSSNIIAHVEKCIYIASKLTYLWHQRYNHLNHRGLKKLKTKKMVHGLSKLEASSVTCADCFTGKQHRNPIPNKSEWCASKILELIHVDICGPIEPISSNGKRQLLCFINDYSRKGWVYFLIQKSKALECFKKYKKLVEKEVKTPIKCLRTDRGGEFNSTKFKLFFEEEGIKRQLTTSYTPHQNSVMEHTNRTLLNMVRCMFSTKKVPKLFQTEAANWTFYLLN